ncbi:glycosyltransferase family 4 protein [Flavobacteriaceae bacterium S0825]|uniref:glycosyltransferase n=1 Tax=Gaetbulibacter sp. S0825 TaxID=2720084 RepID=UPI00142FC4A6|nr:glycosyltransferase family 4 protein [Flavobacteriaceae bacterium S0825]NIX65270.1 glycosyltransferase family 4 protein [Gaetbulibacter sp. S0825]
MRKKVLIITYYWPPAGGPGVQRWLKFIKYLPEFDIEPIVYIPKNPNYPIIDESLVDEIPNDLTIIRQPIVEPYKLASKISKGQSDTISKGIIPDTKKQSVVERLMLFVRGNFFIPDARKKWVKPSVNYLSTYIRDYNIDTIITTGPPHSLHLIGEQLKSRLDIKWIADFRDPWTTIGYHKKLKLLPMAKKKHKFLESKVLNAADTIVVTSNNTKQNFLSLTEKPIEVITNGYDYESVGNVELDVKFSLAHIGSLLSDRNPEVLWKVLEELMTNNKIFASMLQLNFVGAVSKDVLRSLEEHKLSQYVNLIGYVPHAEAVKHQRKSQILLLIEIDSEETKCIIPGKLFEYMVSNRPILAIGPEGSDVHDILRTTNTGNYFLYSDHDAIKEAILDMFQAFSSSELKSNGIGLQQYSRKSLTKKLAELIN